MVVVQCWQTYVMCATEGTENPLCCTRAKSPQPGTCVLGTSVLSWLCSKEELSQLSVLMPSVHAQSAGHSHWAQVALDAWSSGND